MKECKFCEKNNVIESGQYDLEFLSELLDPLYKGDKKVGSEVINKKNKRFNLWICNKCEAFWEWRPLYEETMYGGEPGEWIKVTEEYVKEHYPGVLD